jgi:DNA repair exonuclease SbcCD nuclease subunit
MIVAVTADLHLTERETHPERFDALDNILEQAVREGIGTLIIAGDLFDEDCRNYS